MWLKKQWSAGRLWPGPWGAEELVVAAVQVLKGFLVLSTCLCVSHAPCKIPTLMTLEQSAENIGCLRRLSASANCLTI